MTLYRSAPLSIAAISLVNVYLFTSQYMYKYFLSMHPILSRANWLLDTETLLSPCRTLFKQFYIVSVPRDS